MSLAADRSDKTPGLVLADLTALAAEAAAATGALLAKAKDAVGRALKEGGKLSASALEREQHSAHGLAWLATYGEAIRQLSAYAARREAEGLLSELDALLVQIGLGEYLNQIAGGIPMSQGETVRLNTLGLSDKDSAAFLDAPAVRLLMTQASTSATRARAAALIGSQQGSTSYGDPGLDETLEAVRSEMRRFGQGEVAPHAQAWHLANALVPIEVIEHMAALGVFGLTIPEEFSGLGLGKEAMCVVSEELSRAWIAVGSLGTRTEIAAELILQNGTAQQKQRWLPPLASGEIIPTAVFTEPNTGSDLASIKTRAVRDGDVYRITGQKTWITHGARADLMTLMARTGPADSGYRGLSMFLAEKPRGSEEDPFPASGMSGSEIEVLGYRGMREYDISFDGFAVPAQGLLGGEEGQGFKQLMATFEAARIQTAARGIGVAEAALDAGLAYARERVQFGKPIYEFPRVADKIVMMAAEILIARQLAYHAAREKDAGRRCDLEAGMAKLLSARVAWAAADAAVQIHGGNGFALEFPASRLLCDARILSIFEGASEIQANVIARRLLED